jgi:hypothetical protein
MRSAPWESKTPTDVQSAVASPVTIASGRFDLFAKPSANDRCFSKRTTAVGRRSLQETQDATGGRADADPQGTRSVLPFRKISVTDSRSDWQVVGIRGEGVVADAGRSAPCRRCARRAPWTEPLSGGRFRLRSLGEPSALAGPPGADRLAAGNSSLSLTRRLPRNLSEAPRRGSVALTHWNNWRARRGLNSSCGWPLP